SGGPFVERERDRQVVQLVGRGENPACGRLGQRTAGRVGPIVLGNRCRHGLRLAGEPSVDAADEALELGELVHHRRGLGGLPESTTSFPATTSSGSPPFATNANRPGDSGKYRWWDCITVSTTSMGRSRNRSSYVPSRTAGHSAR